MSDIQLPRLRKLRSRAANLLSTLKADLTPFESKDPALGFRRKPDSESSKDDVNVTTTCSCLMSLAHSGKLRRFFGDKTDATVESILANLMDAPWMSSGLSENNAFTTTLMIRLWGSLIHAGIPEKSSVWQTKTKRWEAGLSFSNFVSFCEKLFAQGDELTSHIFQLLPRSIQKSVEFVAKADGSAKQVTGAFSKEQREVSKALDGQVRTSVFYSPERFSKRPAPEEAKPLVAKMPCDAYHTAQLNRILLQDVFAGEIAVAKAQTLPEIAVNICSEIERFRINDYPPAAAVVYWCVDGIDYANLSMPVDAWRELCTFATEEFRRQRSLVVSKHTAMMDPIAMAMAACLCARLRSIGRRSPLSIKWHPENLPSMIELERAVVELFGEQTQSGLWPKYFPLFHYQDAGSNFCYTFELLEAVLVEFGGKDSHFLSELSVIEGLELAVTSCEIDRLESNGPSGGDGEFVPYNGWNSGGNLETLRRGQPESWATAVVHMFLGELVRVLSNQIQTELENKYKVTLPNNDSKGLEGLLDISVLMPDPSLKGTLKDSLVKTFLSFTGDNALNLRNAPIKDQPMSALLFGPPGTSKTQVAKAIAADLNWALLEIDPSHFLQTTFQDIYFQAERIFEDVMDMCGVVVLFDEMDALVQKRGGNAASDIESKFLTTYMLPKLAKLHDQGQLIFLMATNFQEEFDDAIKRAGRFDLLLCMGPPTLKAKCDDLHVFWPSRRQTDQTKAAGSLILEFLAKNTSLSDQLSLYTFGEFRSFISRLGTVDDIEIRIKALGHAGFEDKVKNFTPSVGLKLEDLKGLEALKLHDNAGKLIDCYSLAALDSATEFNAARIKQGHITMTLAIKYMLERKQSKFQI